MFFKNSAVPTKNIEMETRIDSTGGRINKVQIAIRLMATGIFLGYMMIWVMMPTNTFWLHWLPRIHSSIGASYFGQQGGDILVYTVPILLIATLACIHLHLENNHASHQDKNKSGSKNSSMALWRRPAFVGGPLGIVTWTELSFLFMFIVLLVWSFAAYMHAMFATITTRSASSKREKVWEAKLDSVALMLGLLGNICLVFLFFPVTRGSSVLRLLGLTSESSIKYHIWLGHMTMVLFTAHGLCYTIFWANTHQIAQMLKWEKVGISNVAGEVALFTGLVMWLTSISRVRRNIFELFFYTHHLYILFVVLFILHVGFTYCWITLPGFYLFLIDRHLRFLQSQHKVRLVSARVLPCQAVELNFSKNPGLRYNPMSSVFINIPSISRLQWHPFTVTSSSRMDPEKLSVVIKSEGSWSQKLYEKLSLPSPMNHLEVSLEGPHGPASTHFLKYDMLVMFSGGSGITPFISIIRELIHTAKGTSIKTPKILLVPAFKKSADLAMLDLLFPVTGTTHDISHLQLQIQAYVTRETGHSTEEQRLYHTIWFKPRAIDSPVSAVLGRNSWLWLGTIIISSSIIFLLLIALVTRFYIYPIDHNTDMVYSYTVRSALNMLLIFMSIAITATVAFLWNKKRNITEMRQIQTTDEPVPVTSPGEGSSYYNVDRELENLPHKSFTEFTKVNYGERPDFEKIIMESEGPSIGVLVSGPKKMRQDIAAICSSGSSKKLQFESISFSW